MKICRQKASGGEDLSAIFHRGRFMYYGTNRIYCEVKFFSLNDTIPECI